MVSNRWIKRAIKQTEKTITRGKDGYYIQTSRHDCSVCDYMKNTHGIFPESPYFDDCENSKGMKCPAKDMCLEYCRALTRQLYKKPLIKRLERHLNNLNRLLEE